MEWGKEDIITTLYKSFKDMNIIKFINLKKDRLGWSSYLNDSTLKDLSCKIWERAFEKSLQLDILTKLMGIFIVFNQWNREGLIPDCSLRDKDISPIFESNFELIF